MFVTSLCFDKSKMSNNNLSTVEANLPPGFRFHPRDEELICDYLMMKIAGFATPFPLMIVVDLNKCEPWDIPDAACVGGKDWYFYSQRDRKYATGLRTNRATVSGYWKATGKDREVLSKGRVVGMRKTLVFYKGRAPKGDKTNWVMHEFRLHLHHHHHHHHNSMIPSSKEEEEEDWVICRVFHKNKLDEANKRVGFDDVSSSSSSGLLMDQNQQHDDDGSSYIHFQAQAQAQAQAELLQVPCFSNSNATAAAAATFTGAAAAPKNGYGGEPIIDNYYTNNNMSIIPRDDDDELMNSVFNHDHENVMRAALSQLINSDNNYLNHNNNPFIWDYSSHFN